MIACMNAVIVTLVWTQLMTLIIAIDVRLNPALILQHSTPL